MEPFLFEETLVTVKSHYCKPERFEGRDWKLVVVDIATFMSAKKLDKLYQALAPCDPIFLLME